MSLVGFKARNHRQQVKQPWVDDRRTPRALFDRLHAHHNFTIDAAATPENAMLPRFWTKEQNALDQSWYGERVWCNPPYSNLEPWVQKATNAVGGGCTCVVMLLPANRCEQKWWQDHIEVWRDLRVPGFPVHIRTDFLPGRLRFEWPADRVVPPKGDRPPFGCVLVTWRPA